MFRPVISVALSLTALAATGCSGSSADDYSYYITALEYSDPTPEFTELKLDSEILGEQRVINVAVPASYKDSPDRSYSVLYMPDGGMQEDFKHIVYTVGQLAEQGDIPELIVVGIENTKRQRDLTGPTTEAEDLAIADEVGEAPAFRQFIAEELMPKIEADYRCQGPKAIIGESLAGYFVAETALRQPQLFDYYVALSPSLWWADDQLVKEAGQLAKNVSADRRLFLSSANEEDIYPQTQKLAEALTAASPSLQWTYRPRMDLTHQTIFRAMKREGLTWAFKEWGSAQEANQ